MKHYIIYRILILLLIEGNIFFAFSQKDLDFSADDGYDDCISIQLKTKCGQTIFPLGTRVCIQALAYVNMTPSETKDNCHNIYVSSLGRYLPKYDGISKEEIQLNTTKFTEYYESTSLYDHIVSGAFYPSAGTEYSFLLNTSGKTYVFYRVKGGVFEPRYPVNNQSKLVGVGSSVNYEESGHLELKVVECDNDLNITNKDNYYLAFEENRWNSRGAGNITLSSIVFEPGGKNAVEAYKTITLSPGIHIKNGAIFHAKALPYPTVKDCDCTAKGLRGSTNYADANFIGIDADLVEITYSDATKNVIVNSKFDNDILNVSVYDMSGRMLQNSPCSSNSMCEMNVSILTSGVYIVQVYTSKGFVSKKITIK